MASRKPTEPSEAPPVVLLFGEQETLRQAALEALRAAVLAGAPAEFNEDRFDFASAGADGRAVLVAAATLPVLGPRRLVRVRGLDDRRAASFVEKLLPGYLEDPVPSTCLLLELARIDRRLRWVKRVQEVGELRDCSGPTRPAEVRAWIERRFAARDKRAARGAAAALLEAIGPDLDLLGGEIEKACLYAGERSAVTAADVAAVSAGIRPHAIWDLTDAIGGGDRAQALRVVGRLVDQGEAPLAIVGALANHFRRLIRARACQPLEPGEVQRRLSLHPYAARKLTEQARRFEPPRLRAGLDAVRRADEAVKGGASLSPRLAVERLVLAVCR
jgi:DNA polymerase-3 subunit delta